MVTFSAATLLVSLHVLHGMLHVSGRSEFMPGSISPVEGDNTLLDPMSILRSQYAPDGVAFLVADGSSLARVSEGNPITHLIGHPVLTGAEDGGPDIAK